MSVNKIMCGNRERGGGCGCGLVAAVCFGSIETPPDTEREEVMMGRGSVSLYLKMCII